MAKKQRPFYRVRYTSEGVRITLVGARGGVRHVYMDELVPLEEGLTRMESVFAKGQALVSQRSGRVRQMEAK
jgi:hypothetical protein